MRRDRHALIAAGSAALLALLAVGAVVPATAAGQGPGAPGRAASPAIASASPTDGETATPSAGPGEGESPTQEPSESASESPSESPSGSPDPSDPPSTPASSPTAKPSDDPDRTGAVEVEDAVLRWGLNDESSNRAFAPGTFNIFSAGRTPDPGKGGTTLPQRHWRQAKGDVAIQKWDGAAWRKATWKGLSTDSSGRPLGSPTSGTFSNHRFVFSGGTGEVDRREGTARIEWEGDVTVLYYSGMATYYLSDPVLEVADGVGTLTATVQGYASSVDDPSTWKPVKAAEVTVADLPEVDLRDKRGFTATPAYLGVKVAGVGQKTDGPYAGAFPQSFVDYMDRLGLAAFWLSSGGITDAFKVASPLTVGYDASSAPPDPTPTSQPTQAPPDNPVVPPPAITPPPAAPIAPVAPPPGFDAAPPAVDALPTAAALAADPLPVPTQLVRLAPTAAEAGASDDSRGSAVWWLGGVLLLLAAATLLVPVPPRKERP